MYNIHYQYQIILHVYSTLYQLTETMKFFIFCYLESDLYIEFAAYWKTDRLTLRVSKWPTTLKKKNINSLFQYHLLNEEFAYCSELIIRNWLKLMIWYLFHCQLSSLLTLISAILLYYHLKSLLSDPEMSYFK